jgi:UDP-glucose 4-epimerase
MKKLAVIGSGIAGMSAAYFLRDDYEITFIEKNDYVIFAVPNIQPHQVRPLFHSDLLRILIPAKKIFKYSSNLNKRVIFLSSGGSVYGAESLNPHTEISTPIPITKYGRYKLSLDNNLLDLNSKYSLNNVILRI